MRERIDSGPPPVVGGGLSPPPGRAVNLLPRRGKPIEKRAEVVRQARRGLAAGIAGGQFLLRIANRLQQRDRIEGNELSAQLFLDTLFDQWRGE